MFALLSSSTRWPNPVSSHSPSLQPPFRVRIPLACSFSISRLIVLITTPVFRDSLFLDATRHLEQPQPSYFLQYLSYIGRSLSDISFITSGKSIGSFHCIFFKKAFQRSCLSWSAAKSAVNSCRLASYSKPLLSNVAHYL